MLIQGSREKELHQKRVTGDKIVHGALLNLL
jgi:hypothetical protein